MMNQDLMIKEDSESNVVAVPRSSEYLLSLIRRIAELEACNKLLTEIARNLNKQVQDPNVAVMLGDEPEDVEYVDLSTLGLGDEYTQRH